MKPKEVTEVAIKEPQRVVAIVGRPNVGKSALFNRLARRRLAIVHEESGVTRDRLIIEAHVDNDRFKLIDTGGIGYIDKAEQKDTISEGIRNQVEAAIEDAAVIIFLVDVTCGQLPLDVEVARLLHACGRTVLLAANKCDNPELDHQTSEFESFGFPSFAISALHKRGLDELFSAVIGLLPEGEEPSIVHPLKVAVVGRPNAGKSSFINRLIRNDRVIVSEIAGTTRDSVEVPFVIGRGETARHYLLIDTAGVRRRSKVTDAVERFSIFRTEKSIELSDVVVLVLDATEGPKGRDKRLASLIEAKEKGCIILVNKWDLADDTEITQRKYGEALGEELPFLRHVPIIFVSSQSGYNIRKSIEAIDYVASQVSQEVGTGVLNRIIEECVARNQPPMVKNKRLKIYYATQVDVRPVRIKLFVNNPVLVTENYRKYLVNKLRASFGLEGAPVILHFTRRRSQIIES
ncbi:MAG: GTP-binding protein [Kiritimatiellia bacterium]|jgi:GTP-binding protein